MAVEQHFKVKMQDVFGHLAPPGKKVVDDNLRSLMFGNYEGKRDETKLYDEITDIDKLKGVGMMTVYVFSQSCLLICECC